MRERPIIMTGESVRAILAGTKTQTRRVAKHRYGIGFLGGKGQEGDPECWGWAFDGPDHHGYMVLARGLNERHDHGSISIRCPYGEVGDLLWVRETWCLADQDAWIEKPCPGNDGRPHGPLDGSGTPTFAWYAATDADVEGSGGRSPWIPPLYMPRWASRLSLRVTDVRVQRLHEISEEDARAEGVERDTEQCDHTRMRCDDVGCMGPTFRSSFCERWWSINGKRAPWASNPWVWAITFEIAK